MNYGPDFWKLSTAERHAAYARAALEKKRGPVEIEYKPPAERAAERARAEAAKLNASERAKQNESERLAALGPFGRRIEQLEADLRDSYRPGEKAQIQRRLEHLRPQHAQWLADQQARAEEADRIAKVESDPLWKIAMDHAAPFCRTAGPEEAAEAAAAAELLRNHGDPAAYWATIDVLEKRAWDREDAAEKVKKVELSEIQARKKSIGENLGLGGDGDAPAE